jgi:DNA polymerase III epsilon subunit-like protein
MKLLSIDIETTGLDPNFCSVLEVGAVLFDPQPELATDGKINEAGRRPATFERLVSHSRIQGEPYSLQMNQHILQELCGLKPTHIEIIAANRVGPQLREWLRQNGVDQNNKVTIVGKNYDAFDRRFLEKLIGWNLAMNPLLERRTLDVGSLYFKPEDGKVASLDACLETIGCTGLVTHRALDDALAVMTAITRFFN